MTDGIHLLYVEDDPGAARLLQKRLARAGIAVDVATTAAEGLARSRAGSYHVLAVDQQLPDGDGLGLIRTLAAENRLPPTIMITGAGDEQVAVEALKAGARDYLVKDASTGYLGLVPTVIEQVLEQERLRAEKDRAEAALRRYAADLQARNEDLDAFAHMVAHDLKNPLTAILNFALILQQEHGTLPEEKLRRFAQSILEAGRRMQGIIEELLLLARMPKEHVEPRPVEMDRVVRAVLARLDYLVADMGAEVVVPASWPSVMGYGPWIEEVWVNYVSNALKYGGRPPRVELGAVCLGDGTARFFVRDNGAGLTEAEQRRLFTPFTRLDVAAIDGEGLGLSIVRRIVAKLGGEVGVESTPGEGSTFSFTLPAALRD